jgi:hypothetical protein
MNKFSTVEFDWDWEDIQNGDDCQITMPWDDLWEG